MPVSAVFAADFAQFRTAVDQATTKLRDFQTDANKVQTSLNRIGDSFSGKTIISQANLAAKAVTDIGGATKLTQSEQARLNATLTEAIAKYTALGEKAPQSMIDLQKATQSAATTTQSIGTSAKSVLGSISSLAAGFGIAFSVGAVVSFGKELLHMGDEMVRVHDRTGLTIKEVQQFSFAAEQSGNTLDELTGAIGQMQNRLASGDKSAIQSVKELGINLQSLTAAGPGEQMRIIADAISKVENPATRSAIAMDLFGKSGTAILPTLTSDFNNLANSASAMSEETVRALDKAGDSINAFGTAVKVMAAESLNALVGLAGKLGDLAFKFAGMTPPVKAFDVSTAMLSEGQSKLTDVVHKTNEQLLAEAKALTDAKSAAEKANIEAAKLSQAETNQQTAWVEATLAIDKNMAATGRWIRETDAAKQETIAFKKAQDDLRTTLALNASITGLDAERIRNLMIANTPQMVAGANQAGTLSGKGWGDGFATSMRGVLQSVPDIMVAAFTGGGGLSGAVNAIGAKVGSALGQSIGTALGGEFGGQVGAALGSLLGKGIAHGLTSDKTWVRAITGFLIGGPIGAAAAAIFGGNGPNAAELAGRASTDEFAAQMASMLTWQRQIEVHALVAAGNSEKWAETILGVRDAYKAAGLSEADADDVVNRLFASEKQGGTATQKVIDEIVLATNNFAKASTIAGEEGKQAFELVSQAAQDATAATAALAEETKHAYQELLRLRGFSGGSGGEGDSETRNASDILAGLSPDAAEAAYLSVIAPGSTHQDWERVKHQYGYALGTMGQYPDFGSGTPVVLHGRERVMTAAEGANESGLRAEVKGLREDMRRMMDALPYRLSAAVQLRH